MHWIECVIYKETAFMMLLPLKALRSVKLRHGFAAIPIDEQLLEEFRVTHHDGRLLENAVWGETEPDPVPISFLETISRHQLVAYIRTRYFGGVGEQAAGVWENGQMVMGPLLAMGAGPINAALRRIGVPPGSEARDEFDSVGLSEYRSFESIQR